MSTDFRRRFRAWWYPPNVEDLTSAAVIELRTNPAITVYTMVDGVEKRRPANQFAGLNYAIGQITDAFAHITLGFKDFSKAMDRVLAPLYKAQTLGDKS